MFKFLQERIRERNNKALIQSLFEPRGQFIKETRTVFLIHVQQELSNDSISDVSRRAFYIRYGIAFAIVMLIIQGSTITYASASDVGPTHLLYDMKRVGEVIQLQFTLPQDKPALHKRFARRRLKEIRDIQRYDNIQQVIVLSNDFTNEIRETISKTNEVRFEIREKPEFCNEILADIRSHEEIFPERGDHWQYIKTRCGEQAVTTAL